MQALVLVLHALSLHVRPHMVLGGSLARDMIKRCRSELTTSEEVERYIRATAVVRDRGAYVVVSESFDVFVLTESQEMGASLLHDVLWRGNGVRGKVVPKLARFRNLREWHNATLNCSVVSDGQTMGDVGDFAAWLALFGKDA